MAQTGFTPIVTYNTATATTVPSAANLAQGELAVNVTDKKLYTKDSGGNVVLLASNGGDVTGPASSTNLAIPTFSGTGGKTLLNNSGVTITAGVITATGFTGALNGTLGATTPSTVVATDLTTTGNTILGNASTDTLNVGNGDLIKDASGNVGIGVTPSAWSSLNKTLSLGGYASISGNFSTGFASYVNNAYQASASGLGGWLYENTGAATIYQQRIDTHVWSVASSGTVGTAITFPVYMKMHSSGGVSIGNPAPADPGVGNLSVTGTINKMAITAPATSSTLAVADGKTLTANKTLTLDGTDSTTMTFPTTSATIARTDAAQTFTGEQLISAGSLGFSSANVTSYVYKPNDDSTGTGTLLFQAGNGSAASGGGYSLFGNAHATYPGWTMAGISSGSGGKFAVNTYGILGAGANVFTVDGSGNVVANATIKGATTISVGAATPSASGAGITFPATQSASTDANTLDDYEEGTFTPTDGSGAGLSFTGVSAAYTKVGRIVTCLCQLSYPATASTASARISGLPFTIFNSDACRSGGVMTISTSAIAQKIYPESNATSFPLLTTTSAGVTNANCSGAQFNFCITYYV